jgi:hypothetical protein
MQFTAMTAVSLFIIIVLCIVAVKTVLPNAEVSKNCLLGYKAACSFTPLSTTVLVLTALSVFVAAKRFTWI